MAIITIAPSRMMPRVGGESLLSHFIISQPYDVVTCGLIGYQLLLVQSVGYLRCHLPPPITVCSALRLTLVRSLFCPFPAKTVLELLLRESIPQATRVGSVDPQSSWTANSANYPAAIRKFQQVKTYVF